MKKIPARTTKWICALCKDVTGQLNELREIVASLSLHQKEMKAENDLLKKNIKDLTSKLCKFEAESKANMKELNERADNLGSQIVSMKEDTEKQCIKDNEEPEIEAESIIPTKTALIIGDSMLRNVKHEHFEDTQVKSMSGAKIIDIVNELNTRDDISSFRNIVIHCGTNDVSSGTPTKDFLESMEAAITSIMISSPSTSVYVSAVCPRDNSDLLQKINRLNEDLQELSTRLGCVFIDTGLTMTYRNGDIDTSLFADGLHFNQRGNEHFLRALADGVPELVRNKDTAWTQVHNRRERTVKSSSRNHNSHAHGRRDQHVHSRRNQQMQRYRNHRSFSREHMSCSNCGLKNHNRETCRFNKNTYSGCYNCGLKNHNQSTCRHKERLRCNLCKRVGHKANYCNVQSRH